MAVDNGLRIKGDNGGTLPPIIYAARNNIKINDRDATLYAIDTGYKIDGYDPTKYAIDENIKIDDQDPVLYAKKQYDQHKGKADGSPNPWAINGKDPKKYALEAIIEEYLETTNLEKQVALNERYKEIHQGQALLTTDSHLGKFLGDDKNMALLNQYGRDEDLKFASIDLTKCDLGLIKKCKQMVDKNPETQPRDYDKLSTKQKWGLAISAIIPPIGGAVYYLMKKSNKKQKDKLTKELQDKVEAIHGELSTIYPEALTQGQEQAGPMPKEAGKDRPKTPQQEAARIGAEAIQQLERARREKPAKPPQSQGQRPRAR